MNRKTRRNLCSKIAKKTITRLTLKQRMNSKLPMCNSNRKPPSGYGACLIGPRKQTLKQMRNTFMQGCDKFDAKMVKDLHKALYPGRGHPMGPPRFKDRM